jgi:hypothetical protein
VKTTRLNPRPRREQSGEILLGHRSYPKTKVYGDQSMTEKQRTDELARPVALQGPRDMAKAGLLEPQSPVMEVTSRATAGMGTAGGIGQLLSRCSKSPSAGRRPMRPFKGANEGLTSR